MKKLPNKPSELIRLAIADLEKVEKNPTYTIDMGDWHVSSHHNADNKCSVCFAGSVMACSLDKSSDRTAFPDCFPKATSSKLYALNEFREGYIEDGLSYFEDIPYQKIERLKNKQIEVVDYQENPKQFKKEMRRIAYNLKRAGL